MMPPRPSLASLGIKAGSSTLHHERTSRLPPLRHSHLRHPASSHSQHRGRARRLPHPAAADDRAELMPMTASLPRCTTRGCPYRWTTPGDRDHPCSEHAADTGIWTDRMADLTGIMAAPGEYGDGESDGDSTRKGDRLTTPTTPPSNRKRPVTIRQRPRSQLSPPCTSRGPVESRSPLTVAVRLPQPWTPRRGGGESHSKSDIPATTPQPSLLSATRN